MLNANILNQVLETTVKRLNGEWVLIGGTLMLALGIEHRSTIDIDIIPKANSTNDDLVSLMEIAQEFKLPVETINSAGSFFIKKIKNWEQQLIVLKKSNQCVIYRPNFELYLKLKIERLSEADLLDLLTYFKWCKKNKETLDIKNYKIITNNMIKKETQKEKQSRLQVLLINLK